MIAAALCLLLPAPLPAQLPDEPLRTAVHRFPLAGVVVTEERRVDPATGLISRHLRDQDGALVVDLDALRSTERALRIARDGKLSPELARIVADTPADELLEVVFWLTEPEGLDLGRLMQDELAAGRTSAEARQLALATARAVHQPRNEAFANRLRAAGLEVELVGDFWPDVFATLPAGQVRAWAARGEVDLCYRRFSGGGPELNEAQGTLRTLNVHDLGVTGASGPTRVLVNDCGEVSDHPWLPPVVHGTTSGASSHPSGVAGNICADNGATLYGAAKGLPQLYSYDGCGDDTKAQSAWSWGLSQGIDLGNCSWWNGSKGSIVFLDRFFDYTIRNFSVMMFKSSGNQGNTGTPYSTSPGNGYNMTNSGCYNDANDWSWANDAMASYSSYWNPAEGHEKPELASPGDGVLTTSTSGTQSFGGTSSASPLTTGVATLLCNQQPALLGSMTTLKAALMVGAWHNVEGAQPVSDKDGAGGVHATASHALVRNGQYETGTFTSASFPGGFHDKQIHLYKDVETRVIALWFSDPDAAYSSDLLKMDLDLTVLDPSGAVVAAAADPYSAWDLVQFTPPVTGSYTVRLTRQKFLGTSEPYTIAWSTRIDAGVAQVSLAGTPQLGGSLNVTFQDRYDPGAGYTGVASFATLPSFVPLNNGWGLPLLLDRYARLTVNGGLPAWTGVLDSSGLAGAVLPLPADPVFVGQTVYVSMLTHDPGNQLATRGVAPAVSFVLLP